MRFSRLVVLGLVLSLTFSAALAWAGQQDKKKKKQQQYVKGAVTELIKQDKENGTLSLRVQIKKKDTGTTETKDQKVTITKDTKFEKLSGSKTQQETSPATFDDLQKDARIAVTLAADKQTAEKIQIVGKRKKTK